MNEVTIFERTSNWVKNSITLKLLTITILMLLLLIPGSMVESIIEEREFLQAEVIDSVGQKWAGQQLITGPILTIPVTYEYIDDEELKQITRKYHVLPETLDIKGTITPEKLRRGIYEVVVYKSATSSAGKFKLDLDLEQRNLKEVHLDEAYLTIGVSDLRGIKNQVSIGWNNEKLEVVPGSKIPGLIYSGMTVPLPAFAEDYEDREIYFSFDLDLQGSENISFIPLGSTTTASLKSEWSAPSFNGNFLPAQRNVNDEGFSASWEVFQLNRNFPQQWMDTDMSAKLLNASFGVDLLNPLDDYQKSMRSAKYAVMTIALTFLIIFLVEIINKRKIHPFQYALVGLALSLFYVLLVSISEHVNFNFAYLLSSIVIIGMVTLYSVSVFKMKSSSLLMLSALTGIYGFLFVTLQLADYALLLGSVGLAAILGATMYFTRNINWYRLQATTE